MPDETTFDLIRKSKLATELTDDQCRILAGLAGVRDLADEEVLIEEGKTDDRLYSIVSGAIAVCRRDGTTGHWLNLHVLTRGELVGELGFLDGQPHFAMWRALGATRVLSLERKALEGLLDSEPRIVYNVLRAIFRVVHGIMNRMGAQQTELTNYIYKQHGKY